MDGAHLRHTAASARIAGHPDVDLAMAGADGRAALSPVNRFVASMVAIAAIALALHAGAWLPALIVVARNLHPPPLLSAAVLALSALLLRVVDVSSRRWRIRAVLAALVIFAVAMTTM